MVKNSIFEAEGVIVKESADGSLDFFWDYDFMPNDEVSIEIKENGVTYKYIRPNIEDE